MVTNLLLFLLIVMAAVPHLEPPRPVMMVTAIVCLIVGVILVFFGGRLDLT
jgi:hypothetical protein